MAGLISQGSLFPPFTECGDCLLADRERRFIFFPLGVQWEACPSSCCLENEQTKFLLFYPPLIRFPEYLTPSIAAPHLSSVDDIPVAGRLEVAPAASVQAGDHAATALSFPLASVCEHVTVPQPRCFQRGLGPTRGAVLSWAPHKWSRVCTLKRPFPQVRCITGSCALVINGMCTGSRMSGCTPVFFPQVWTALCIW